MREVEPYYGKYKGILATDNMVQLKQYYGSATGSILRPPTHHAQDNSVASRTMDLRVATATSKATALGLGSSLGPELPAQELSLFSACSFRSFLLQL